MDPYSQMANRFKEISKGLNSPSIDIGKVVGDNPLRIQKGELILEEDDVIVADYLTDKYQRKMEYTWKDDGVEGRFVRDIQYRDKLEIGDKVALLAVASKQLYIVLARVVQYG